MSWGSAAERLWSGALADGTGCWLWQRATAGKGYGTMRVEGKPRYAHRLAYELVKGPIPVGLTIDHLCRVHNCINPDHLEVVTQQENVLRGEGPTAANARKDYCSQGHPYDETNTYHRPTGGREGRHCRACAHRSSASRATERKRVRHARGLKRTRRPA